MRFFLSTAAVVGLFAGSPARVEAQYPQAIYQGPPLVYQYTYPNPAVVAPDRRAFVPYSTRPPHRTGYVNRPYYGAYGYGFHSNGSTDGFPPFRGRRPR